MVSQHITYWGKEYTDIKSTSISLKKRKKKEPKILTKPYSTAPKPEIFITEADSSVHLSSPQGLCDTSIRSSTPSESLPSPKILFNFLFIIVSPMNYFSP